MKKWVKIASIGSLTISAAFGVYQYVAYESCLAEQSELNQRGYYRLLPERAEDAAAVMCRRNHNEVVDLTEKLGPPGAADGKQPVVEKASS